eukprot:12574020-Alexandrium_andersonii.AAC.1
MDGTAPPAPRELAKQRLQELLSWHTEAAAAALAMWLWRVVVERQQQGYTFHQWHLTLWVWLLGAARVDQLAR